MCQLLVPFVLLFFNDWLGFGRVMCFMRTPDQWFQLLRVLNWRVFSVLCPCKEQNVYFRCPPRPETFLVRHDNEPVLQDLAWIQGSTNLWLKYIRLSFSQFLFLKIKVVWEIVFFTTWFFLERVVFKVRGVGELLLCTEL